MPERPKITKHQIQRRTKHYLRAGKYIIASYKSNYLCTECNDYFEKILMHFLRKHKDVYDIARGKALLEQA